MHVPVSRLTRNTWHGVYALQARSNARHELETSSCIHPVPFVWRYHICHAHFVSGSAQTTKRNADHAPRERSRVVVLAAAASPTSLLHRALGGRQSWTYLALPETGKSSGCVSGLLVCTAHAQN